MSTISLSIFLAVLTGGCVASWKGALLWNNRTRDANKEDPRDQEIRELAAALSVSRKQVETLGADNKAKDLSAIELEEKLKKAGYAVSNAEEKSSAARDALNKEIESKEDIDVELARLRKELGAANTRLSEIDVEVKIASPGSGLVAGMDDVVEDDEKEMFTIRHEHRELKQMAQVLQQSLDEQKAESERWKKHCAVMTKTNKALRCQVDELPKLRAELDRLGKLVELLETTQEENRDLQVQIAELSDVKAENETLLIQVAKLESTLKENEQLQDQIRQQTDELGAARQDNENLLAQVASLSKVQDENQQLLTQIAEQAVIVDEHAGLVAQVKALRNIEAENENLLTQVKELRDAGARQLEQARAEQEQARIEIEQLLVRVAAIDEIQEENTRLLAQGTELRHAQALIETQREQLETLANTNDENTRLQARIDELGPVEEQNEQLRVSIDELTQTQNEQNQANNELGARIEKLTRDLQDRAVQIDELLLEQNENENLRAQLAQISQAHEQAQVETEELGQQLAKANEVQAENEKLWADLDELNRTHEQAIAEQHELKLQLAEVADVEHENEKLQVQFADLTAARDQLLAENDRLREQTNELDQAQEEMGGLQEQVETLNQAQEEHLARQQDIETKLEFEKDENSKLTEQLDELARKLEARKTDVIAHDHVKSEKRAVESSDSAEGSEDTDSLPTLILPEIHDDLKSIRGVGAKIEQKLNMLGISNFRDLLLLAEDDYKRAAELIPNLEGRMKRDAWMDQARVLHQEKYNEAI